MTENTNKQHLAVEEDFHDTWAESVDPASINVRKMCESITAPELRYISEVIGNFQGKHLLDLGCGLGEASAYFALKGAIVTSVDLSGAMLDHTVRLCKINGVSTQPIKSSADQLKFTVHEKFDIIYAGNLFHHIDLGSTLAALKDVLKDDGMLVSWDPVAYNPIINLYRRIATKVRTPDEHPLTLKDIEQFNTYFSSVTTRFFWFTTLIVFIVMAMFMLRNPNKVRYWKKVVEEGERWAFLYSPLERLDTLLLSHFPVLNVLCWNVVIVAKNPKPSAI